MLMGTCKHKYTHKRADNRRLCHDVLCRVMLLQTMCTLRGDDNTKVTPSHTSGEATACKTTKYVRDGERDGERHLGRVEK